MYKRDNRINGLADSGTSFMLYDFGAKDSRSWGLQALATRFPAEQIMQQP